MPDIWKIRSIVFLKTSILFMWLQRRNVLLCKFYNERSWYIIRNIGKTDLNKRLTIGILGCTAGAGVTHLAITLSNLCHSKLHKKTALLELHKRKNLSTIPSETTLPCRCGFMGNRTVFDIHGVDYYPDITPDELPELYNQGYHILLLDFGSFNECCINEFLRCDRKLVIGSLAPWNIRQYRELLESISHYTNLGEGFYCLTRTESPKQIRDFSRLYQISISSVPSISDPFYIKKEHFSILQEFICWKVSAQNIFLIYHIIATSEFPFGNKGLWSALSYSK